MGISGPVLIWLYRIDYVVVCNTKYIKTVVLEEFEFMKVQSSSLQIYFKSYELIGGDDIAELVLDGYV